MDYKPLVLAALLGLPFGPTLGSSIEPNPFFSDTKELKQFLEDNSSFDTAYTFSTFGPDSLTVEPGPSHTWRISLQGVFRKLESDGTRPSEPVSVYMDYAASERKIVGGTGHIAGITFCAGIAFLARNVRPCYGMPSITSRQQSRASFIAQHYVAKRLPDLLTELHSAALSEFRKGHKHEAAELVQPFTDAYPWMLVPVTPDNVEAYNDFGYFLTEGGRFKDAAQVLEEVTRAVPDRAAAYLNLGDAFVGLADLDHARGAFLNYQRLMKASGKEAKIPKRILKYLNQ
jgi:tetratricopeptide (TPR) repeat protein